jgi:pimeloyl-ACP methyl ester carboxylesterase
VPSRPSATFLALSLVLAACSAPAPNPSLTPSVSAAASASEVPAPSGSPGLPTVADDSLYYPKLEAYGVATPGQMIQDLEIAAPQGMRAWFVVYASTGLDGEPAPVSGIVLAPDAAAPEGGFPIVAWAHGTTGIADQCAPSKQGLDGIPLEVRGLVEQGYVVTATDYEGLGTMGIHPYLVGKSEGRSVLDSIMAAQGLPDAHAGTRAVVIGHSQGGHAALWSAELAPSYAPGLTLLGAFAGSPPADLPAWETWAFHEAAAGHLDAAGAPLLLFGVWNGVYDAPLSFLTNAGRESALAGREACRPTPFTSNPFLQDPAVNSEWRNLLAGNSPGAALTGVPIRVVSARADAAVQYESQVAGVDAMCAVGDIVELVSVDGDHEASMWPPGAWSDVMAWIADRFADAPSVTTCVPLPSGP